MLRGIDISNWQAGIVPSDLPIDFCICKATEGTNFVDGYCDGFVQDCISHNIKWGFYHYAKNNDPYMEADWFVDNCLNYFGHGIPVLDWEEGQTVNWVNLFVQRVRERTGVNCWIYSTPWFFNQGGVDYDCARWVATWPNVVRPGLDYDGQCPEADGNVVCWQYASDGYVPPYQGNLDVNVYYGDEHSWDMYANPSGKESNEVHTLEDNEYKVTIERKE